MKKINWKTLIITCVITLLPIFLGLAVYGKLPEQVAIHWGMNNEPNGWLPKNYAVFAIPVGMMLVQIFCCIVSDIKKPESSKQPKIAKLIIWLIPILTIILYTVTIVIALGKDLDIRLIVCLIIGILFIAMGNYFPKMSYESRSMVSTPYPIKSERAWRKFSRAMGITLLVEGILVLASIFFPPIATGVVIALLILAMIGLTIYGAKLSKES